VQDFSQLDGGAVSAFVERAFDAVVFVERRWVWYLWVGQLDLSALVDASAI
jgi:hypothetical protein